MRSVYAWITDVGCAYYRVFTPLEELARQGWRVAHGAGPPPPGEQFDVVVGQRITGDSPAWLALCADPDVLAVYDMDDDLINIGPENTVPHRIYAPVAEQTRKNVRRAGVVTVCTPYVLERMSELSSRVVYLPICVRPEVFELPLLNQPGRLTVGWGGSQFHAQDWAGLPTQLVAYSERVPRATFHLLGADYTGGVLGSRLRVTGYQPLEQHYASLDLDIGLAPLMKSEWNRGKSWTKPLEYATRGTPVVATAWGQYADWVDHGVNGLLVQNTTDWVEALVTLSDDAVRAAMSSAARETARKLLISENIQLWESAYAG